MGFDLESVMDNLQNIATWQFWAFDQDRRPYVLIQGGDQLFHGQSHDLGCLRLRLCLSLLVFLCSCLRHCCIFSIPCLMLVISKDLRCRNATRRCQEYVLAHVAG